MSAEEDALRRRVTVRKSNMNPKNIGSYMEGGGEGEGGGRRKRKECCLSGNDQNGEGAGCWQEK